MTLIKKHYAWLIPFILALAFAPFSPMVDLNVSHYFYVDGHFQSNNFLSFVYKYGMIPGWILALLALMTLFSKPLRSSALIIILTMIVGAELIVHVALKDHWGRPRPKQVIEFGGHQQFRPFYKPNFFHQPEPSKSFPSGHSSMGFVFFSLAFAGQRLGRKWLYWTGMIIAFVLGVILSYTRVAQGGHFFSDVLLCGVIMWWTALFFNWLIYKVTDEITYQKTV